MVTAVSLIFVKRLAETTIDDCVMQRDLYGSKTSGKLFPLLSQRRMMWRSVVDR